MKISDGRINYLSRMMASRLISSHFIVSKEAEPVVKEIKRALVFFNQGLEAIDARVRSKISTLKRGVPEGSSEWDILYRQYYNEEVEKM